MDNIYFDLPRTLKRDALFNYILSNRGAGKTYGFKLWAIQEFIRTGAQFIYLRRFKEELKKCDSLFNDIAQEFPDHEFKVKGKEFYIDDKLAGYAIALSTSKMLKSVPFPRVNKICYDEFLIDRGYHRFIPDEVTTFLELYSTVSRDRQDNFVKVLFLANAITISNPYFSYFKLQPKSDQEFTRRGDHLIQIFKNQNFIDKMKSTRFGKLISDTPYAAYSIDNDFLRDNYDYVEKKNGKCVPSFTISHDSKTYGVWTNYDTGLMYISKDTHPNCYTYVFSTQDYGENTIIAKFSKKSRHISMMIECFKSNAIRYESIDIKNKFLTEIIRIVN